MRPQLFFVASPSLLDTVARLQVAAPNCGKHDPQFYRLLLYAAVNKPNPNRRSAFSFEIYTFSVFSPAVLLKLQ